MVKSKLHFNSLLAFILVASLWLAIPASGQNTDVRDAVPPPGQNNNNNVNYDDITRRELAEFNQFLDNHPEIAEQVRKDPSLVDNRQFVTNHPALQSYLQDHPGLRDEIKQYPDAFMRAEDRYEGNQDRRDDITHGELARFNQFLDSHPEIAEQLRKDPSLVDDRQFVTNHPALQSYLQDHPALRVAIKEHPEAFMKAEDHYEDRYGNHRNGDSRGGEMASFGEFLGGHSTIAEQISRDPSLVRNQEYMANHPELQQYLNAHPGAQTELTQNPESFIKSAQQFDSSGGVKSPMPEPKPKQ